MRSIILAVLLVVVAGPTGLLAQDLESAEPFKVGTFQIDGEATVALVLRDSLVVDIGAANAELELDPTYPHLAMPADMLELIGQYEYGLKFRLYEIVNDLVAENRLAGSGPRPRERQDPASDHVSGKDYERRE